MMISIVVPCYNEENNIKSLVSRLEGVRQKLDNINLEIILVNNGSSDNTEEKINEACSEYEYIKKINVIKNEGYGFGILKGLEQCTGEWLGWIHADLQLPPEAFLRFANIIKNNLNEADNMFFKGRRKNRPLTDVFFTMGMGVFESLYLHERMWDINAQPTMIHKSFYRTFHNPPKDFSLDLYVYYMARKKRLHIVRVPVIQHKREEGVSSWNDGMKSRVRFIKRTLEYSKKLKMELRS